MGYPRPGQRRNQARYDQNRTLKAQVAEQMRDLIASGEWPPGESIGDVMKLSQRFGVSFGTVRAAEEILVDEGLLHPIRPGIPTRVATAPPPEGDLGEAIAALHAIREQLATVAANLERLTAA